MNKTVPESYALAQKFKQEQDEILKQQKVKFDERVKINNQKTQTQLLKHFNSYKIKKEEENMKIMNAEQNKAFFVPQEPHFFVVVRIRGMNRVPPKERKTLDLLRLRNPNAAVLLTNNKSTRNMLQLVRNYVGYGYISLSLLRELIYKRGLTKVDGKVVNITNEIIEDTFGDFVCVEDLIEALWSGRRFSEINRFFMPFKLNSPKGGFKGKKSKDFLEGGECGNHYELIGDLIKRMID